MPTNRTPNYNLSQWQKADKVLMEDFNADNSKIDAALKAQASALAGKADSSKIDATLKSHADALAGKAEASALTALTTQVGTLNCRAYTTGYTGDGTTSHTLTFPGKPWLVLTVMNGIGTVTIRGRGTGLLINTTSIDPPIRAAWSGNSVTLTHSGQYVSASGQNVFVFALIEP